MPNLKSKKLSIKQKEKELPVIGWREWISLPELKIARIKAKIDTGARTSSLHAFSLERFRSKSKDMIRFAIHPLQHSDSHIVQCVAQVLDRRYFTNSGGYSEERYVIQTLLKVGSKEWPIELNLTNRDIMTFRLLLGRTAVRSHYLISPKHSFLIDK